MSAPFPFRHSEELIVSAHEIDMNVPCTEAHINKVALGNLRMFASCEFAEVSKFVVLS